MLFILYFMSPDSCVEKERRVEESDDKAKFNKKPSLEILSSGSVNEGERDVDIGTTVLTVHKLYIFIENFGQLCCKLHTFKC